jgi:hypothetical protein
MPPLYQLIPFLLICLIYSAVFTIFSTIAFCLSVKWIAKQNVKIWRVIIVQFIAAFISFFLYPILYTLSNSIHLFFRDIAVFIALIQFLTVHLLLKSNLTIRIYVSLIMILTQVIAIISLYALFPELIREHPLILYLIYLTLSGSFACWVAARWILKLNIHYIKILSPIFIAVLIIAFLYGINTTKDKTVYGFADIIQLFGILIAIIISHIVFIKWLLQTNFKNTLILFLSAIIGYLVFIPFILFVY